MACGSNILASCLTLACCADRADPPIDVLQSLLEYNMSQLSGTVGGFVKELVSGGMPKADQAAECIWLHCTLHASVS